MINEEQQSQVNCYKCIHFYITWDQHFPNGCRFFNLKSRLIPSREVQVASNITCQGFTPKI